MGFREALALGLLGLLGVIVVAGIIAGELNYTAAVATVAPLIGVVYGALAVRKKDDE